jgi:hypothetical protein
MSDQGIITTGVEVGRLHAEGINPPLATPSRAGSIAVSFEREFTNRPFVILSLRGFRVGPGSEGTPSCLLTATNVTPKGFTVEVSVPGTNTNDIYLIHADWIAFPV